MPEGLGEVMRQASKIKLVWPPVELPPYLVKQHWHERYHQDPGNRWLTGTVAELNLA